MSILETVTGSATFTGRTAKCQAFFVPTRDNGGSEQPLGITVQQNVAAGIRVAQRLGSVPAGQGMNPKVVGEWRSVNYEIPDGTVVKIFGDRHVNGVRSIANQYIRMRANGPFWTIKVRLTEYGKASVDEATFRGRFDVLSPDEAKALGARIMPGLEKFYTRAACGSVFRYEQLAPALVERTVVQTKQVTNSEGEAVVVAVPKSRRRIVVD